MTDALDKARAALVHAEKHDVAAVLPRDVLRDLIAEHERLTAPPTEDEREELAALIHDIRLRPVGAQMNGPFADAILAAGFRRQGPVTEAEGRAAFLAFMGMDEADFAEMTPTYRAGSIAQGIAALEASRKVTP